MEASVAKADWTPNPASHAIHLWEFVAVQCLHKRVDHGLSMLEQLFIAQCSMPKLVCVQLPGLVQD